MSVVLTLCWWNTTDCACSSQLMVDDRLIYNQQYFITVKSTTLFIGYVILPLPFTVVLSHVAAVV